MFDFHLGLFGGLGHWMGTPAKSEFDLARIAEAGLPTDVVRQMTAQGLTTKEVFSLVIPERTLKHRKTRQEHLSRDESDRAIRAARALAHAESIFGTQEKALKWMRRPAERFEGRAPMEMLVTETGARLVEEMLIQIDEGMFA